MKNVKIKMVLILASFGTMVSFQNCAKVTPGILIDDQLASGLNTDEIAPQTEVPVDIGQVETPEEPSTPAPETPKSEEPSAPVVKNDDDGGSCGGKDNAEQLDEDQYICQSKSGNHNFVTLDASKTVYDGSKESKKGNGNTYIYASSVNVGIEVKNTHGRVVICGGIVQKISSNSGSLVLINAYAVVLDGKNGNVILKNSTIGSVLNMKGVIKKL